MPLNSRLGLWGLAKQTGKGVPATPPLYAMGLSGGDAGVMPFTTAEQDLSSGSRVASNTYRSAFDPAANPQSYCYQDAIGALLLAAMGTDTVTGTTDKVHTFSSGSLPWWTLYGSLGGSEYWSLGDAKLNTLKLSWTGTAPLIYDASWLAMSGSPGAASWTATTNKDGASDFFVPVGGTFKFDAAGAAAAATVIGGDVSIDNQLDSQRPSGSIAPGVLQEGGQKFACSLTVIPDDLTQWRKALTGTGTGTTPSPVSIYGGLELDFVQNMAGTATLQIFGARVDWQAALPAPSQSGGAVQLSFSGIGVFGGTAAPLSPVLTNAIVSY